MGHAGSGSNRYKRYEITMSIAILSRKRVQAPSIHPGQRHYEDRAKREPAIERPSLNDLYLAG
jgi:hypothetical protein